MSPRASGEGQRNRWVWTCFFFFFYLFLFLCTFFTLELLWFVLVCSLFSPYPPLLFFCFVTQNSLPTVYSSLRLVRQSCLCCTEESTAEHPPGTSPLSNYYYTPPFSLSLSLSVLVSLPITSPYTPPPPALHVINGELWRVFCSFFSPLPKNAFQDKPHTHFLL